MSAFCPKCRGVLPYWGARYCRCGWKDESLQVAMTPSPVAQGETARTPRTDALLDTLPSIYLGPRGSKSNAGLKRDKMLIEYARTLERELQQARAEAEQARSKALEEAAGVCEEQESEPWYGKRGKWIHGFRDAKTICAAAIRALKPSALEGGRKGEQLRIQTRME